MGIWVAEGLGVLLAVSGIVLLLLARVRGQKPPDEVQPQPPLPDRRTFLNRVMLGSLALFTVAFGGGTVGSLWPTFRRGFGSKIIAGKHDGLLADVEAHGTVYNTEGRFYLVRYETTDPTNRYVRDGVVAGGLMALYQKCSHLGCRVPFCSTSRWFECPCHGARFNLAGEVRNGPAQAGLWRFPIEITPDGSVVVDTRVPVSQPPGGVDTTGQQPAGSFCVDC